MWVREVGQMRRKIFEVVFRELGFRAHKREGSKVSWQFLDHLEAIALVILHASQKRDAVGLQSSRKLLNEVGPLFGIVDQTIRVVDERASRVGREAIIIIVIFFQLTVGVDVEIFNVGEESV